MANRNKNDSFWDLGDYRRPNNKAVSDQISFPAQRIAAIEINDEKHSAKDDELTNISDTVITKFIPPHSNAEFAKKNILFEYEPSNPLIKKVIVYSQKEGEQLFVSDNLFIRERRALLDRTTTFKEPVPFYSYAPRYSQLNKAQLNWYIWWRQNARNGNFIKTDESYILLYAYELAATEEGEDICASLESLCALITSFDASQLGIVYKIMIRDIICDFCLIHKLPCPTNKLGALERQVIFDSFLPEFFIDLSQNKESSAQLLASMSVYDYRRSKCYNKTNAETYKQGIEGSITSVIKNEDAFDSLTSFTKGLYNNLTEERHPFSRMTNIVNKNIKLEIVYYEISNIRSAITDIVRYSENKIRDYLGIRNKISVISVNPSAKLAIDQFFEENLPAHKFVDKRRKDARVQTDTPSEYDKFYDTPKTAISPERALEIERESWDTTKKLTEAFSDIEAEKENDVNESIITFAPNEVVIAENEASDMAPPSDDGSLYSQLHLKLGDIAGFVNLCKGSSLTDQRKFASIHNASSDEIADKINEAAAELFGDIILESNDNVYTIIEDYIFLFE